MMDSIQAFDHVGKLREQKTGINKTTDNLRDSKTELFNKLVTSQSQQMILTRPTSTNSINNNNSENGLDTTSSAVSVPQNLHQQPTADQQQQHQQRHSASCLPTNQQDLTSDEFKREPVAFSRVRNRWYTNEEVASILTNFSAHPEWQTSELQVRPKSGAVLLYSREKVRYRQDGYCWKKRKNGRTTREDHMKLKVQGIECIYGCYVHSAILPTFHRRCYWLLQNPDIVLVHYLNQPPEDQSKMMITFNSSLLEADTRRSWTNEEIIEEIGSVFGGISQIQHTLNINFPTSTAVMQQPRPQQQQQQQQQQQRHHHQQQQQQQQSDLERVIESSPQSQQSHATTTSDVMNEQMDMTIVDPQQLQQQHQQAEVEALVEQQRDLASGDQEAVDEMMAKINHQDNYGGIQPVLNEQPTIENLNCDGSSSSSLSSKTNGHVQQLAHNETANMTFDIINEHSEADNSGAGGAGGGQSRTIDCFGYPASGSTASNPVNVTDANNNSINRSSSTELTSVGQMEQNLCSPVTQIYNKIVDDIETYALPLEPNQFNSSHHHLHHHHTMSASSLPMQSMDLGDSGPQQQTSLLLIQSDCNQQQQQQQQQRQQQQQQQLSPSTMRDTLANQLDFQQHFSASLSPTAIPMDNSSEILVNSSNNFHVPPAYSLSQPQHLDAGEGYKRYNDAFRLLPILDYVPNWSNITGGAKVLLVGNWSSILPVADQQVKEHLQNRQSLTDDKLLYDVAAGFSAIFDDLLVPATLIQDNVLRCYAPSHEQGFVTLKVLYMNHIVSEQVLFEMRPSCGGGQGNQSSSVQHNRSNSNNQQDTSSDNNGNNHSGSNNNTQQHRNSTSSNQSSNLSGSSSFINQKPPQISPSSVTADDSSRVLTLAENIISAMHKKHSTASSSSTDSSARNNFRLAASLDIESLDHNHRLHQHYQSSNNHLYPQQVSCQRQGSLKGAQRQFTGFRSLSRDSDPISGYALNLAVLESDPYWHQSPHDMESMQPLSVITDFQSSQSNYMLGQKRHSNGSAGGFLASGLQQSAFMPYVQRGSFQPIEQSHTETSSSGLGSIVSSLSPSSSSLHSPSSGCTTTAAARGDTGSPCSCGRQSSGMPTSADFCEYFQASAKTEESFASLTLNDREQRELYEAAKIIQKAYRTYRGRKRQASELLVEPASGPRVALADFRSQSCGSQPAPGSFCAQQSDERLDRPSSSSVLYLSQQPQQPAAGALVRCYRDREMQAATIIQAYYRRYRQYVHYKRQEVGKAAQVSGHLVVDTLPVLIDKATLSHVDRKRFKTAILMSGGAKCARSEGPQVQPRTGTS